MKDEATANGFGLDGISDTVVPLGVLDGKLLVSVNRSSGNLPFLLYQYDGTAWTMLAGPGAPHQAGLGNPDNYGVVFCCMFGDKLILPAFNFTDGIEVWTYDGTSFERIGKAGDSGCWDASQLLGAVSYSPLEGKLYMGTTDLDFFTPSGGRIYSYDGSAWSLIADAGIDNVNNLFFYPLARGEDLYVAADNVSQGCRVYRRSGSGFTAISDYGMDGTNGKMGLIISSYRGKLLAVTSNAAGGEVWTTPVPPSIDCIVPAMAPRGRRVRIEGHDFLDSRGSGTVTFNGTPVKDYISWSDTAIEVLVPPGATDGPVEVSQPNGDSNEVDFIVQGSYYFAEGYTGEGFQEYLCIGNASDYAAAASITYMFPDGGTQEQAVEIPAKSRTTVNVNAVVGTDREVSAEVTSADPIVVERPMYFLYKGYGPGGTTR